MNGLTYATVCSGVECMSVAAIGLPLKPVFFSEIEPFPCAVLKHRFPHVPNLGDMSRITINENNTEEDIDYILKKLPPIIERLRSMSPLWEDIKKKEAEKAE